MNHQLTFGYRCLHGISNLLTVCRVPIETKGRLEVHNPWKLVSISNQLCDTLCVCVYKAVCVSLPCFCCQIGMVLGYNLFLDVKSEERC